MRARHLKLITLMEIYKLHLRIKPEYTFRTTLVAFLASPGGSSLV